MGIDSAIASVAGGLVSASASKKAASAQLQASRESNAVQERIYEQNREDLTPWRQAGQGALAEMMFLNGIGPDPQASGRFVNPFANALSVEAFTDEASAQGQQTGGIVSEGSDGVSPPASGVERYRVGGQVFDTRAAADEYLSNNQPISLANPATSGDRFARFRETPGYQFAKTEGLDALRQTAAANGQRLGGNTLRRAMEFQTGLSDQTYGQHYNRLASLAGTGQTATNTTANLGSQYAGAVGANNMAGARAQASGYMGQANAFNGTINSLFSTYGAAKAGMFGDNPWSFKG